MKEKIKITLVMLAASLGIFLTLSPLLAQKAFADNTTDTSTQINSTGILPCGGNEGKAATNLLNNPTQENIQKYKDSSCQFPDIFKLIARITNILIGFAGIYAILLIVVAGFRMVFSAGNSEMLNAGKEGLSNAIIGFVLVMIAYVVVNIIFELFNVKLTGQSSGFLYNPFLGK